MFWINVFEIKVDKHEFWVVLLSPNNKTYTLVYVCHYLVNVSGNISWYRRFTCDVYLKEG